MEGIIKIAKLYISEEQKDWKNKEYTSNFIQYLGSNDWIRCQFNEYIINLLCEVQLIKNRFK